MPFLIDDELDLEERQKMLEKATSNHKLEAMRVYNPSGAMLAPDGHIIQLQDKEWYRMAKSGKRFVAEPSTDASTGKTVLIFSVPIYSKNHEVKGVLSASILASSLSDDIKDIRIGKNGECYILGVDGNLVADKNFSSVEKEIEDEHVLGERGSDIEFFEKEALKSGVQLVGYYNYKWGATIACHAKIESTGWHVFIHAPLQDFMESINRFFILARILGLISIVASLIIIFFISKQLLKPVLKTVGALKNIAMG